MAKKKNKELIAKVHECIEKAIGRHGLSNGELVEKTGWTYSTLMNIRNGVSLPTLESALLLSSVLGEGLDTVVCPDRANDSYYVEMANVFFGLDPVAKADCVEFAKYRKAALSAEDTRTKNDIDILATLGTLSPLARADVMQFIAYRAQLEE